MSSARASCHVLVEPSPSDHAESAPGEIRVFCRCRNERLRLPAFLSHYRALGAARFFFIDNGSTDGTIDYLASQPDVRVFRTANRFSESRDGTDWINALLGRFGVGFWSLAVDVDELLVFPGSERTTLTALTRHLDRRGAEAFWCLLVDCYPSGPLRLAPFAGGDRLLDSAPYFDSGPYRSTRLDRCPGVLMRGGMRERIFYPEFRERSVASKVVDAVLHRSVLRAPWVRDVSWIRALRRPAPPCLTKVPLVRWSASSRYLHSTHWIADQPIAEETGVLLHFKFLADFHARAVQEVERNEHYEDSAEYRRYVERLARDPDIALTGAESVRFEDSDQLVRLGLMHDTDAWAAARARALE